MIYSEYGRTGAQVSVVGFGGMRFDPSKSNEENAQLLLYAQSKGINYFDTAPGYCTDTSEDIFGIALEQMADTRDSYCVSTKGMPTSINTADKARRAVEKSIRRLNVDKIADNHIWGLLVDRAADAGDCVECAACEEACTQHLDIIERLKEIAGWEKKLHSRSARFLRFAKKAKGRLKGFCRLT